MENKRDCDVLLQHATFTCPLRNTTPTHTISHGKQKRLRRFITACYLYLPVTKHYTHTHHLSWKTKETATFYYSMLPLLARYETLHPHTPSLTENKRDCDVLLQHATFTCPLRNTTPTHTISHG